MRVEFKNNLNKLFKYNYFEDIKEIIINKFKKLET
jgi:hypothetical protein